MSFLLLALETLLTAFVRLDGGGVGVSVIVILIFPEVEDFDGINFGGILYFTLEKNFSVIT